MNLDEVRPEHALRTARLARGLSLRALAADVGMSCSALSKLENGRDAITYDQLLKLGQVLDLDLAQLVETRMRPVWPKVVGRRSVTSAERLPEPESDLHTHSFLSVELRQKAMVPLIVDVKARSVNEMGGLVRHYGEEFLHVVSGRMELHSDLYEPLPLSAGESIYFDSGMAHAYVRLGDEPCRVLAVCVGTTIQQLARMAGTGWHDMSVLGRRSTGRG